MTATSPRKTAPAVPSNDNGSPSRTTNPSGPVAVRASSSTISISAPTTQGFPIPRATTAACEVLPPRLVRIPWAAIMPPEVLGVGLTSHQDHLLASGSTHRGSFGVEHRTTDGCPR